MVILFLFILGISVGSFLNVVIDRLPRSESIIKGRSHCDFCQHTLLWYDLIPLFSFIQLKRKCRYCGKLISWQYPIVELTAGLLFVFSYSLMVQITELKSFFPTLFYFLIVISGLIAIFFTDLKYRIIPDQIVAILICVSLIFEFFFNRILLLNHLLSGLSMFLIFGSLIFITKGRGMGFGDAKFAFFMGQLLGYPHIVVAFYLSFLTGAMISLILVVVGRKTIKSTIPFGPFLVVATVISLFYGDVLWKSFIKVLGI